MGDSERRFEGLSEEEQTESHVRPKRAARPLPVPLRELLIDPPVSDEQVERVLCRLRRTRGHVE